MVEQTKVAESDPSSHTVNHPDNPYLLIDGDIFLYRCGFAVEKKKYLVSHGVTHDLFDGAKEAKEFNKAIDNSGVVWSRREVEPVENALQACKTSLRNVFDKFWPNTSTWRGKIYLTGKGNFRDMLDSGRGYKDNRDPSHRPAHYRALKDYLIKEYDATVVNGEEADDAIGKEAYARMVDKFVVVSNDKDLDQISGFHFDWTKNKVYYVNDEDALKFFYTQLLCGDPTDNIPGVISKAKAEELIAACNSPKDCAIAAKEAYEKAHGEYWGDKIEVIGELVWIRKQDKVEGRLHNPFWEHYSGA